MRVYLEPDEPRVLAIPYRTPGEPTRRFWNLKARPSLVGRVEELRDCPELRAFVTQMNSAESGFATLGCAHWTKPAQPEIGFRREAGLYVDLVFDRLEVASRRRCIDFVTRLRRRAPRCEEDDLRPGLTVIRVQLQRVAFRKLDRPAWLLSTWVFGAASTDAAAIARRRRAVAELAALCARVRREIARTRGRAGTPIPP